MKIRMLDVSNFRGISKLTWSPNPGTSCLIGPGDSTKSTILTAIEYVLHPRHDLQILDTDFHNQNLGTPFDIQIVLGDLPPSFLSDDLFGLQLSGFDLDSGRLSDEPENGLEQVLHITLSVSDALIPEWTIKGDPLHNLKRSKISVTRLTEKIDTHISWSKGSALSKATQNVGLAPNLPDVFRSAAQSFNESIPEELSEATKTVTTASEKLGLHLDNLTPGLLQSRFQTKWGALGLFVDKVPIFHLGLGSKKLLALALQKIHTPKHTILLIDEIETGLEPNRIQKLLLEFGCLNGTEDNQIIFTTHSPTPIIRLPASSLCFVQNNSGIISVKKIPKPTEKQNIIRTYGASLLARKLIVGEGATEVGLMKGFLTHHEINDIPALLYFNVDFIDGRGCTCAPQHAIDFQEIGYHCFLLADSDEPISPAKEEVTGKGVQVALWDGSTATEERLFLDLPAKNLKVLIDYVIEERGEASVFDTIKRTYANDPGLFPDIDIESRYQLKTKDTYTESERKLLGKTAKRKSWYKNITSGEKLGEELADAFDHIEGTPTHNVLSEILTWLKND